MTNLKTLCVSILICLAYCPSYKTWFTQARTFEVPAKIESIMDSIRLKESNGNHLKIGMAGERTEYQITPGALVEYNKSHGTRYTMRSILNDRALARKVATWCLLWAYWHFSYLPDKTLRLVCAVSAYNIGYRNVEKYAIVRKVYVCDVVEADWQYVRAKYVVSESEKNARLPRVFFDDANNRATNLMSRGAYGFKKAIFQGQAGYEGQAR